MCAPIGVIMMIGLMVASLRMAGTFQVRSRTIYENELEKAMQFGSDVQRPRTELAVIDYFALMSAREKEEAPYMTSGLFKPSGYTYEAAISLHENGLTSKEHVSGRIDQGVDLDDATKWPNQDEGKFRDELLENKSSTRSSHAKARP